MMDACILDQHGEMRLHRNMPASPETFLKAMAPYRDDMVVAVEGMGTWSGLAALGAREAMPFVLGHALSMQAMHGGKAKNDRSAAPKITGWLRGGMLPQASLSPAQRRATRDRRRRRVPLRRKRAERWAHVHHTTSQDHVPESDKPIADTAHREGVAARLPAPAVPQSLAVDLAWRDAEDRLLTDLACSLVQTARHHDATTLSRLQTVPGMGKILRRGLREASPQVDRCPRVQDVVSSCRLVTGAKAAGQRSGPAGKKLGTASLQWAFAEAAGLLRRHHAQGQALPILARKGAGAVSYMGLRGTVFAMDTLLKGYGRRTGEPAASLDTEGLSLQTVLGKTVPPCVREREEGQRLAALSPCGCLAPRSGFCISGDGPPRWTCAAPLPHLQLTGAPPLCSPPFA
jgi:hypothetical protein